MLALGTLGPCIDFLLGESKRSALRGKLETLWYQFDDIRWRNFGTREIAFFITVFDKFFGRSLWSRQRAKSVTTCVLAAIFLCLSSYPFSTLPPEPVSQLRYSALISIGQIPDLLFIWIVLAIALFPLSLSFTRFLSNVTLKLMGANPIVNIGLLAAVLAIHLAAPLLWSPVIVAIHTMMGLMIGLLWWLMTAPETMTFDRIWTGVETSFSVLPEITVSYVQVSIRKLIQVGYWHWSFWGFQYDDFYEEQVRQVVTSPVEFQPWARDALEIAIPLVYVVTLPTLVLMNIPTALRVLLSAVFLSAYVLRPIIEGPVALVWARIVESNKPPFTIFLGGLSAGAKIGQEALKIVF